MRSFFIISLFILFSFFAYAQEPVDTTLGILRMNDPGILLERPVFVLPFTFALAAAQHEEHPSSLYHSLSGVPQSFAWEQTSTIDLTAPIKLQLRDAEKDRPWKVTLGAMQLGGVAYVAYKHIKKYGFK